MRAVRKRLPRYWSWAETICSPPFRSVRTSALLLIWSWLRFCIIVLSLAIILIANNIKLDKILFSLLTTLHKAIYVLLSLRFMLLFLLGHYWPIIYNLTKCILLIAVPFRNLAPHSLLTPPILLSSPKLKMFLIVKLAFGIIFFKLAPSYVYRRRRNYLYFPLSRYATWRS